MTALSPLSCPSCSAPVPLPVTAAAASIACVHCSAAVPVPADYLAALSARVRTEEARAATEALWRRLSAPPAPWVGIAGLLAVVLLPVIATLVASLVPHPPWPRSQIYATVTLPALAPGALTYLWARAVETTVVRFKDALGAHPPTGRSSAPTCRVCGAPLAVPDGALAVTCGYCGSDSLVEQVPVRALQNKLRDSLRTLDDAGRKLRGRKIVLGAGGFGLAIVIGGLSWLLRLTLVA